MRKMRPALDRFVQCYGCIFAPSPALPLGIWKKIALRHPTGPLRKFALFGLTVDAIYRRDDQMTQKDRRVVSADRHKMTLPTTGTVETGLRMTGKPVFQKQ